MKETQLKALLREKTTPLYVFDLAELRRRVQYLRQALPEKVKLCYAVKANPFILEELSGLVDRLEICSPGELHICRQLGLPGEKIQHRPVRRRNGGPGCAGERRDRGMYGLCGGGCAYLDR